jgi:hypothetical protein
MCLTRGKLALGEQVQEGAVGGKIEFPSLTAPLLLNYKERGEGII